MSGSTSLLDVLASSQSSKETTANTLFNAMSQAALFGKRDSTTTGLTWGYFGGNLSIAGTITLIANGTVALTGSTTNYVEANTSGVVSANTTAFSSGFTPLYTVVTSSSGIISWVDKRLAGSGGTSGSGSGMTWRNVTDSTTLVLGDAGDAIQVNKATATQVTIPPSSSVPFTSGDSVLVFQRGAGQVAIIGGVGVTILNSNQGSPTLHATRTQYSVIALINHATDVWIVTGDTY